MLIALCYELRILKLECDVIQRSMGRTEKTQLFQCKPFGSYESVLRGMRSHSGAAKFPDFVLSSITLYLGNSRQTPTTKFILESGFNC